MSRISSMSQITTLTGLEFIELIQLGTAANYAEAVANGFTGTLAQWETTYVNFKTTVAQLLADAGDGASAYEIAIINGFVGTEAQWLASLHGKSAYQAAVDLGYVGTEIDWVASLTGKSAYEVAVEQGFIGTPSDWLASLEGNDGQSAYALAVSQGFVGDETAWLASLQGSDGQSAYSAAVAGGFVGTEADWLASLEGTDGQSAYQAALAGGFVGTEAQWLESLKGQSAYTLAVSLGFVGDEATWLASLEGTAGQSAYQLAVSLGFAGDEAAWLATLNGSNGQSAYQLAVDQGFIGTEAQWLSSLQGTPGQTAYQTALDNGFVGTEADWLASLEGTDGLSAYQAAVSGGFVGTEAQWLASLQGSNGQSAFEIAVDNGFIGDVTLWLTSLQGKSAYQIAVDNGFVGNEATWLASLNGTDGQSAYALAVSQGFIGTEVDWLNSLNGTDGKSAYQSAVDNGFVGTEAQWIASIPGQSAYELAVAAGYVGTEAQWLDSLNGAPGSDAYAIAIAEGFVGTEAQWLASLEGKSAYTLAVENGYVGTEAQWLASLQAVDGKSAFELAVDNGFVGTEAEWLTSLEGTDGTTAYAGAVDAGYVGTETQFYNALATVGEAGTDINGGVFITNVVPINVGDNVGDVVRDVSNISVLSFSTTGDSVRVTVMAFSGHTNYQPVVTVNSLPITLIPVGGQYGVFQGTIDITFAVGDAEIAVSHEDGAYWTTMFTRDMPPEIQSATLTTPYPGSQTELKENDAMSVTVTADVPFVAVEIANYGIFKSTDDTGLGGVLTHVISGAVANRGTIRTAHYFRVRVQKANGSWSSWYDSVDRIEGSELTDYAYLNNLYPTVSIGVITYPATQTALKGSEQATVANTASNFDTIQYDSPNSQVVFLGSPSTYEAAKQVERIAGTYNISTTNFRITAVRAANGAQVTQITVVRISDVMPTVSITTPAARLRSGGNGGTVAQNHTITLTSTQALSEAPSLNAPEGTWLGSWTPNGAQTVWTRQLQVHDDNVKGVYSWNSLSAKTISGNTQTTINSGGSYTLGGFVFRTLQIPAYPNREVTIGTQVVDTSKLRCTNLSKGESGSLNYTYNGTIADMVDQYTITGPTGVANPTGNLWYNKDVANASSNTSGIMEIELEEVV